MAPRPAVDPRLQRLASAFTPEWLAAQRWFRGKGRGLTAVELTDAAQVAGSSGWLLVLEATDDSGAGARYLVPAVLADGTFREPRDGEGLWQALGALMIGGGELNGARGRWVFAPTDAAVQLVPGGTAALGALGERRLRVQQSNTSVALGEALMLKLYRLLEAGVNPEVEMNAFLTAVGFREAPALAGSATYHLAGESHSAAMLQQLVASRGDGWTWMLDRLKADPQGPSDALRAIAEIGRLTAAMHAALAARPTMPGFPSRAASREERSTWRAAAEAQLKAALEVLDAATRPRLATLAPHIAAGFAAFDEAEGRVSRIHGDYHLGQLLRTADGFCVIDFEGEPARPLAARRAPSSPLRDVAGMLRSLDYAAHAAGDAARVGDRSGWLAEARDAFMDGYGGISAGEAPILAAFELEKACYEVEYEANNRPDWVWLPLEALERQAPGRAG